MNNLSLPAGTQVDQYTVQRTLGGGGFSVVYLALDAQGTEVVLKEYLPSKLATRAPDLSVAPIDDATAERLAHGRRLFFQEASTLAQLKHPNIVDVTSCFRANGTVYMVMTYMPGHNLQHYIKRRKGLSETFLRTVFPPLLEGLKVIHSRGLLHLDIKPGNIHLRQGGSPLLLDFGAVHEMMHSRRHQASQVLTPGFAPIEQLDPSGYLGPWSDIYAIGATLRTCMAGQTPPSSKERFEHDTMRPAAELYRRRYSGDLLRAVDWAMEVDPMLRPQNVDELLEVLPVDTLPQTEEPDTMLGRLAGSFSWIKG
ncbi:serine/threonine protein kinase [Ectothiorhodospiraceae bacterium 2226]|nr:serine/threonine protein kinase [Ectothiorhodospiraceae bacterium 2226]